MYHRPLAGKANSWPLAGVTLTLASHPQLAGTGAGYLEANRLHVTGDGLLCAADRVLPDTTSAAPPPPRATPELKPPSSRNQFFIPPVRASPSPHCPASPSSFASVGTGISSLLLSTLPELPQGASHAPSTYLDPESAIAAATHNGTANWSVPLQPFIRPYPPVCPSADKPARPAFTRANQPAKLALATLGASASISHRPTKTATMAPKRKIAETDFESKPAIPPSLPPSVEEAYRRKCVQLKNRTNEVEDANDAARLRLTRIRRQVEKLRIERAFLLEQLSKRTSTNVEDSEGSPSPPPTVCLATATKPAASAQ